MSLVAHDIGFLKETLHAQQELLQKLYNELDVERESSAIAADEALSMILRLQGEKSAMEMEASQYKRIAEEKMCHAQETVELFQELIYQKEMLIASLDFQVQAYRFKLQSMGVDLEACEIQFPEHMLSRRSSMGGETSGQSLLKRGTSLPPLVLDVMSRRGSMGELKSSQSVKDFKEGELSSRKEHSSIWDEIRKLEDRVKELVNVKSGDDIFTPVNPKPVSYPSPEGSPVKSCSIGEPMSEGSQGSSTVHDVFEVPQCPDPTPNDSFYDNPKSPVDEDGKAKKVDTVWDEISKSDEKKPLLSPVKVKGNEVKLNGKKLNEKGSLFKHPTCSVADFEVQQFNRRLKQIEDGRFTRRRRDVSVESISEELRLLREILEKVDKVQDELTNWRPDKPPPKESVGCIKAAMQCFWP